MHFIIYHFLLWKPHMCFVLYTCIIIYLLLLWKPHMWFVKYTSLYITSYYGSPIRDSFYIHPKISLIIMKSPYVIHSIYIQIYHLLLWKLHMWFVKYPTLYVTYYYGSPICVLFYRHPCISLIIKEAPYVIRYIHMHNYISLLIMEAPYVFCSIHMHNYISLIIMKDPYVIR